MLATMADALDADVRDELKDFCNDNDEHVVIGNISNKSCTKPRKPPLSAHMSIQTMALSI